MIDFIDFKIPLRKEVVVQMNDCGFVDFKVLAKKTGLKISAGKIEFSVQGGGNSEAH
ncbi:phage/plasmid replication protein, II/X family, partial [Vibrio lentus]